jgi:membrane-bound lytic murein transglycosylase D
MISKVLLLLIAIPSLAFAWPAPESFNSSYIELEEHILAATITKSSKTAKNALDNNIVDTILNDRKSLVHDDFKIPKYFEPAVSFWFSIYTQYTSHQVVIHDKQNLSLIYKVIDFSELHSSSINKFSKSKLQSDLSLEYVRTVRSVLKKLRTKNLKKLNTQEYEVFKSIRKVFKVPKNKKKRFTFFKNLAKNLRTQTGQRDMIYQGVVRSLPYLPFLNEQIKNFKLPKELIAISFLESSFNIKARSKVAAVGIWQFMPYIGNLFMPRSSKSHDYRQNPIISSVAALHLLKQNKMILKRWDLAIPAYNSGTKHLVKARKKFRHKKNFSLAYVLENYKTSHIGFASKNFYSEFLALAHVLAYKDIIYPLEGIKTGNYFKDDENINVFISKCSITPKLFINKQKKSSPQIKELNSHFYHKSKRYPRGTLFVSDLNLSKRKYKKVTNRELRTIYPKKLFKLIKRQKCGSI